MPKTLVLYAYFESGPDAAERLRFFCDHGIHPGRDREHVIVINGGTCSVASSIPAYDNVSVLRRPNTGWDFGAWAHALRVARRPDHDLFVFVNSSVMGPFLPAHADRRDWVRPFSDLLDDFTKLVGISVIDAPWFHPHVQSMFMVTDRVGLDALVAAKIFDGNDTDGDFWAVVFRREQGASRAIMEAGYGIGCVLPAMRGRRYTLAGPALKAPSGDVWNRGVFGGLLGHEVEPLDCVFFKANRGCAPASLAKCIAFADHELVTTHERAFDRALRDRLDAIVAAGHGERCGAAVAFMAWAAVRFRPRVSLDLGGTGEDGGRSGSALALASPGVGQVVVVVAPTADARKTHGALELHERLVAERGQRDNVRWTAGGADEVGRLAGCVGLVHMDGRRDDDDDLPARFAEWKSALTAGAVVLVHGASEGPDAAGRFFDELPCYRTIVPHAGGLGVACRDPAAIATVEAEWVSALAETGDGSVCHRAYALEFC